MLSIAKRNADHLKLLIDDLLDIEKLIAGNMPIASEEQDIGTCVTTAIEESSPSPNSVRSASLCGTVHRAHGAV